MQHVMIDLETLGTHSDAVILSIGAVKFDIDSDQVDDAGFYASVSIDSNLDAGRRISEATLLWWLKQSAEAQVVFHEPKNALGSALNDFVDWFHGGKFVWANGASFDLPMLSHAMRKYGMEVPWDFYNERCVRTYKNLPGARDIKVPNPLKHNALHDALAQVHLVQAIQKKLKLNHPMVKS